MSGRDVDSDVTYEITDVTDNSEGYYKCLIETSRGKDEGITYLDVEEQPPLIDAPDRLLVSPGQTAELKEPFKSQGQRKWGLIEVKIRVKPG